MLLFILGLLTLPVLAGLIWLAIQIAEAARESWLRWKPTFIGSEDTRARHAAGLAVARRVLRVRLPGGWVLVYHSTVSNRSDQALQAWRLIRDALDKAALDPIVLYPHGVAPMPQYEPDGA